MPYEQKETISFQNLTLFKEAALRKLCGYGYHAERYKILWKSTQFSWNWFGIRYGLRYSDKLQIFPIWNVSHNNQRALMLGCWKFYIAIIYCRKYSFNQKRKLFLRNKLWKFYQLVS